jgi:TRAP-type C4-dicarboxylate transport system permease small subunit
MAIADLAVDAFVGLFRAAGRILVEVVFELLIVGAGYLLIRIVKPQSKPSEAKCALVGIAFWLVVGIGGYFIYAANSP